MLIDYTLLESVFSVHMIGKRDGNMMKCMMLAEKVSIEKGGGGRQHNKSKILINKRNYAQLSSVVLRRKNRTKLNVWMQHWKKKQQQQQKCFLIALPLLLASSLSLFVALMTTHKYACDLKSVSFWFFFVLILPGTLSTDCWRAMLFCQAFHIACNTYQNMKLEHTHTHKKRNTSIISICL